MSEIEVSAREFIRLRILARQLRGQRREAFFACEHLEKRKGDDGFMSYVGTPCFKETVEVGRHIDGPEILPLEVEDYCAACKRGVELGKQYRAAAHGQGIALRRLARAAREE